MRALLAHKEIELATTFAAPKMKITIRMGLADYDLPGTIGGWNLWIDLLPEEG